MSEEHDTASVPGARRADGHAADDGLDGWDAPTEDAVELARPEPCGLTVLDEAVAELATLGRRDLGEHVAVFEQVHARLRATLDDPDPGSS